jgi:hypothetical protein
MLECDVLKWFEIIIAWPDRSDLPIRDGSFSRASLVVVARAMFVWPTGLREFISLPYKLFSLINWE